MAVKVLPKRDVRIGNVSGATGDSPHAMLRMAKEGEVDVIVRSPRVPES
jgi:hypothetical protein